MITGDWEKLSHKQQLKVKGMICNDWTDVSVTLQNFDNREPLFKKQRYGSILIKWKRNGKDCQTTVSGQCSWSTK